MSAPPQWLIDYYLCVIDYSSPPQIPQQAAIYLLADAFIRGGLEPFLFFKEVHYLVYLLEEAGEPLGLQIKFDPNFRVHHLEEDGEPLGLQIKFDPNFRVHYLDEFLEHIFADREFIEPTKKEVEGAKRLLAKHPSTLENVQKVIDLISGYETGAGVQLLAEVCCHRCGKGILRLQDHKFSQRQIDKAFSHLEARGFAARYARDVGRLEGVYAYPQEHLLTAAHKRRIQSAVTSLNNVLEELRQTVPDAQWYLEDTGNLYLLTGPSHTQSGFKSGSTYSTTPIFMWNLKHSGGGGW